MKSFLIEGVKLIFALIYPKLCFACEKQLPGQARSICVSCHYRIAPTNYHKMEANPVIERFWGRIELQHASSGFEFAKGGLLQNLIHHLKYGNNPEIGIELGKMHGSRLILTSPYNTVDFIVPVPLHFQKIALMYQKSDAPVFPDYDHEQHLPGLTRLATDWCQLHLLHHWFWPQR